MSVNILKRHHGDWVLYVTRRFQMTYESVDIDGLDYDHITLVRYLYKKDTLDCVWIVLNRR